MADGDPEGGVSTHRLQPRIRPPLWGFLVASVLIPSVGMVTGGELEAMLCGGLEPLPLALLAVLAYLGLHRPWARLATTITQALLLLFTGAFLVLLGALSLGTHFNDPNQLLPPLEPGAGRKLLTLTIVLAGCAGLGCALTRGWGLAIRTQAGSPEVPIPECAETLPVHRLGRSTVFALTLMFLAPLIVLNQPPLLVWIGKLEMAGQTLDDGRGSGGMLRDELYGLMWTVPACFFAVGYALRRSWREACERLGLVRPTRAQLGIALAATIVLLGATSVLDESIVWAWNRLGWPTTDMKAMERLFAFSLSPLGALVIGVVAGLGEELAIRGVLQPRLGILASNLFFAALHAPQYHWDGVLSVFLIGLALAQLRKATNTTTSALVHGSYDFIVVLWGALESGSSEAGS